MPAALVAPATAHELRALEREIAFWENNVVDCDIAVTDAIVERGRVALHLAELVAAYRAQRRVIRASDEAEVIPAHVVTTKGGLTPDD
jgi:hypothetical protein